MRDRSEYEKKSKEKSDPTKGKRGGVDTRRMYDNVLRKYEKEYANNGFIPTCQIQSNVVMKEESTSVKPQVKKKRLIRRLK